MMVNRVVLAVVSMMLFMMVYSTVLSVMVVMVVLSTFHKVKEARKIEGSSTGPLLELLLQNMFSLLFVDLRECRMNLLNI